MKRTNSMSKVMLYTLITAVIATGIVAIIEYYAGADVLFTIALCSIPVVFVWCCATMKA